MSRYYIISEDDKCIKLWKSYHNMILNFDLCELFPTDIERIIHSYINCEELIIITKNYVGSGYKCECDVETDLITYDIDDQTINNELVSMSLVIGYCENNIHYLTLERLTDNVAKIIMANGTETYQTSSMMNLFMKHYYNKKKYIEQENCYIKSYETYIVKNLLLTYDVDIQGIEVINKRLFKNIIVILKCIINNLQKN